MRRLDCACPFCEEPIPVSIPAGCHFITAVKSQKDMDAYKGIGIDLVTTATCIFCDAVAIIGFQHAHDFLEAIKRDVP